MICSPMIKWHFESSILNSKNSWISLEQKLKKWRENAFQLQSTVPEWISRDLGENDEEIMHKIFQEYEYRGGNCSLASFLFVKPSLLSLEELSDWDDPEAITSCYRGIRETVEATIQTFFEPKYKDSELIYSFLIRKHKVAEQHFLFSSVVFPGEVYWQWRFAPSASLHPNSRLATDELRRESVKIVEANFPHNMLRR